MVSAIGFVGFCGSVKREELEKGMAGDVPHVNDWILKIVLKKKDTTPESHFRSLYCILLGSNE